MAIRTVILFLVGLLACGSCFRNNRLDSIESYIQERPDSALVELQNLSPSALKGKAEKARYALLYSIALDKNYIDIQSDSIIIQSVNWYERVGDKKKMMLSYLYAGKVEYNSSNYAGAVSYAQKSIDLAIKTKEYYYHGLANWLMGDIYYANHNYLKAKGYYDQAKISFLDSGKDRYASFSECESAKMCLALGDYHKCDSLLTVINSNLLCDDDALLSTYYSLVIRSCSLQVRDMEAISAFNIWRELTVKSDALTVYGQMAISFARNGDKESANYCLSKAYQYASEDQMPIVSTYSAGVHYINGEYKSSIDSLQKGYDYQNKVAYVQFANSIDDALSEYYKSEVLINEQKLKGRLSALAIFAALLLTGIIIYYRFKKNEFTKKLNAAKADIAYVAQLNKNNLTNFNRFLRIRQNVLDDVVAGYSTEKHYKKSGIVYDIVDDRIESLKAGGEGFKKLVKDLNACFGDIVRKLRESYPTMTNLDYHILVYYFSGFSQETVSTLTNIPVEKLYNLKRSWVQRFNLLPSPLREQFLGRMNTWKYLPDTNNAP